MILVLLIVLFVLAWPIAKLEEKAWYQTLWLVVFAWTALYHLVSWLT